VRCLGGADVGHAAKHHLVTQTSNPTDSPYQRGLIEDKIYRAVDDRDEVIQYDITPIYGRSQLRPRPPRVLRLRRQGIRADRLARHPCTRAAAPPRHATVRPADRCCGPPTSPGRCAPSPTSDPAASATPR
jgi:hypothetical protein